MNLVEQRLAVTEAAAALAAAAAKVDANEDASVELWQARRALRAFGRRRAKRAAPS